MNLRLDMPLTAAWIDALREAFGRDAIDPQIRAAVKDGLPTFHASENGREVGVAAVRRGIEISAAQMVIQRPKP